MSGSEQLILPDRCLAVFVDDTGHERLVPGHPVYGLGGCAVLGRDLDKLIWQPWRKIRSQVTGSQEIPFHAHEFPAIAKSGDMELVADFFRTQPFRRFGSVISVDTKLTDELSLMQAIMLSLQKRISDVLQPIPCRISEVKVIFEASQRADALVQEAFELIELHRGWRRIPADCYFMPKSAAEPALEVADFIIHAIGRQARKNLQQRGTFLPDFKAIFHGVDPSLVSYLEIESIARAS